jgi:hypothetical protein
MQILVKCFDLVSLCPGGVTWIVDYRHNHFEFSIRNFGQWMGTPGPGTLTAP